MARWQSSHRPFVALILVVFALSLALRWDNVSERRLISHNEDATAHVLTTMRSMEAAPPAIHHYLPIATISQGAGDRNSENFFGTSIEDSRGNYYYASFPPLGFAAPYLTLEALHLPMDLLNLRLFSAALGLASAVLLYLLLARVLAGSWLSDGQQRLSAFLLTLLFLLNSESLWIFGNIYWHHVLLQPLLLLSLLALLRVLDRGSTGDHLLLGAALFFSCMAEWSGFLLAGAVALVGLWRLLRKQAGWALAITATAAGAAALGVILWHFSMVAGLDAYLQVLASRPRGHVTKPSLILDLLVLVLPLYLPMIAIAAAMWFARAEAARPTPSAARGHIWILLFCAAAAAGQSVLLLHHSIWYTYGTLPITTFVLIAMAAMVHLGRGSTRVLGIGSAVAVVFWIALYFVQNPPSLNDSAFGRQFSHYEVVRAFPGNDYVAFTNLAADNSQMEPVYAGRNLIEVPTISQQPTLAELQAYLRRRPDASGGKLFLFAPPGAFDGAVWWAYTKTPPFERNPALRIGPIRAVLSVDREGISALDLHSSALLRSQPGDGSPRPLRLTAETRALLGSFDLTGARCAPLDGRGFHHCTFAARRGR